MEKKQRRGGIRAGAGRKKKPATTVVSARVPTKKAAIIKTKLLKLISDESI